MSPRRRHRHSGSPDPGALLTRTDLRNLGLERGAVDAIFRQLPVVAILGVQDRPMIRAEDVPELCSKRCTDHGGERVAPCRPPVARPGSGARKRPPRLCSSLSLETHTPGAARPAAGRTDDMTEDTDCQAGLLAPLAAGDQAPGADGKVDQPGPPCSPALALGRYLIERLDGTRNEVASTQ